MEIVEYKGRDETWDEYVQSHPHGTGSHRFGWRSAIEGSYRLRTFYLVAMQGRRIAGILPLVLVKGRPFSPSLVSMPFLNYGGVLADGEEEEYALVERAVALTRELKASYLELRQGRELSTSLSVARGRVGTVLDLFDDPDALWRKFRSKLRSQIRRPMKENMDVRIGDVDDVGLFYSVFSENMRDLGSPVHSRRFFHAIMKEFPRDGRIVTIMHENGPVASGLVIRSGSTVEVPWASSLRRLNRFAPNMLLYWSMMRYACEEGCMLFDLGRSRPGEGTDTFKRQWGGRSILLPWYYWLPEGAALPDIARGRGAKLAVRIWSRLPVALTVLIGPRLRKGIPL